MNNRLYFSHDINSRNDPKLIELQMEMGGEGLAIFWCLVEMLYENDGEMPYKPKMIAFTLRWTTEEAVQRVISEFNLFQTDGVVFWSEGVRKRMALKDEEIARKREVRKKAADIRWGNTDASAMHMQCNADADAMQTDANKIKENKIKENKIKDIYSFAHAREKIQKEIFKFFFFKNVSKPEKEAERFCEYWQSQNWTRKGDSQQSDPLTLVKFWEAQNKDKNFSDSGSLIVVGKIFDKIQKAEGEDKAIAFLQNVYSMINRKGNLTIVMKTDEWGCFVHNLLPIDSEYSSILIAKKP